MTPRQEPTRLPGRSRAYRKTSTANSWDSSPERGINPTEIGHQSNIFRDLQSASIRGRGQLRGSTSIGRPLAYGAHRVLKRLWPQPARMNGQTSRGTIGVDWPATCASQSIPVVARSTAKNVGPGGLSRGSSMKRAFVRTLLVLLAFVMAALIVPSPLVSRAPASESITGPLAAKLSGVPPLLSIGGQTADEVKAKIRSGKIKLCPRASELPPGVKAQLDVEYGKGGQTPLLLDLFQPKALKQPVPGLIFIHGGSWNSGSRKTFGGVYCRHFAQKGYVVATIDYRLSGDAPFPAAIQDVNCAIRWMRANAARLGVDPNKIGLIGGSTGAHLAMLAAYSADRSEPELQGTGGNPGVSTRVEALVDLYGPNNLNHARSRATHAFMQGKTSAQAPELYAKASPINYVTKDAPPTLIVHGSIDEVIPVRQSDNLAARLSEQGVPYLYDRIEGWQHAMDLTAEVHDHCTWMMDQFLGMVLPLSSQ